MRVRPSTLTRYQELQNSLRPTLGWLLLAKLRESQVQASYRALLDQGLAPATVLHTHRMLRQALSQAVKWRLIAHNPTDGVDPPRPGRYEAKILDVEDSWRVLEAADETQIGSLVHLLLYTGLRVGEALGLTWPNVDLDQAILYVRRTARRETGKGIVFGQPKTHRSSRPVPLSPDVVARLRAHRSAQLADRLKAGPTYEEGELVFANSLGKPLDAVYAGRIWREITKTAGVEGARLHDLRHCHATLLLKAGVSAKAVSERLGHSQISITMDTYTAVLPGIQEDAVERFDRLISGKG